MLGAVLPLLIAPGLLFHYDTIPKTIALWIAAAWALLRLRQIPNELAALKSRTAGLFIIRLAVLSLIWFSIATAVSIK
ncbi:MAG TPA: hypothetical protein VHB50_00805, partial [Bryobacteraceae bacterium]|nr:hypothetical protein [Bryobacteraceae bacterium]